MPSLIWTLLGVWAVQLEAKVLKGSITVEDTQWEYVDRFVFETEGGILNVKFNSETAAPGQQVLIYHDLPEGFASVYESGNSCEFKRDISHENAKIDTSVVKEEGWTFYMTGMRPRWWYIVVANCDGPVERVSLEYEITFTNPEGKYTHQFSYDEYGIFEAQTFAILMLTALFGLFTVTFVKQRKDEGLKTYYLHAVMMLITALEFIAMLLQLIHRELYAVDGVGWSWIEKPGIFLEILPDVILTATFMFISKGWLISVNRVEDGALRAVLEVVVVYLICGVILFVWSYETIDPVEDMTIYQTAPGYIIVAVRCCMFLWFSSNVGITWRNESNIRKKKFYWGVWWVGIIYYLTQPLMVLLAFVVNDWQVKKTISIVDLLMTLLTYTLVWVIFGYFNKTMKAINKTNDLDTRRLASSPDEDDIDDADVELEMGGRATGGLVDQGGFDDEDED